MDVFATTGAVRRAGGARDHSACQAPVVPATTPLSDAGGAGSYSVCQAPVVLATTPVTAPSVDPASPSTAISAPAAWEVSPPPLLFVLS